MTGYLATPPDGYQLALHLAPHHIITISFTICTLSFIICHAFFLAFDEPPCYAFELRATEIRGGNGGVQRYNAFIPVISSAQQRIQQRVQQRI